MHAFVARRNLEVATSWLSLSTSSVTIASDFFSLCEICWDLADLFAYLYQCSERSSIFRSLLLIPCRLRMKKPNGSVLMILLQTQGEKKQTGARSMMRRPIQGGRQARGKAESQPFCGERLANYGCFSSQPSPYGPWTALRRCCEGVNTCGYTLPVKGRRGVSGQVGGGSFMCCSYFCFLFLLFVRDLLGDIAYLFR